MEICMDEWVQNTKILDSNSKNHSLNTFIIHSRTHTTYISSTIEHLDCTNPQWHPVPVASAYWHSIFSHEFSKTNSPATACSAMKQFWQLFWQFNDHKNKYCGCDRALEEKTTKHPSSMKRTFSKFNISQRQSTTEFQKKVCVVHKKFPDKEGCPNRIFYQPSWTNILCTLAKTINETTTFILRPGILTSVVFLDNKYFN